jgi:hypothetical protein
MCHAAQPRWPHIYRWKGGRYVEAGRDFPAEYHELSGEIDDLLQEYPKDPQLWEYRGIVREIQGRPREARAAYRRAVPLLVGEVRHSGDKSARRELRDVRSRLSRLSGREGT